MSSAPAQYLPFPQFLIQQIGQCDDPLPQHVILREPERRVEESPKGWGILRLWRRMTGYSRNIPFSRTGMMAPSTTLSIPASVMFSKIARRPTKLVMPMSI